VCIGGFHIQTVVALAKMYVSRDNRKAKFRNENSYFSMHSAVSFPNEKVDKTETTNFIA
jgi:hypothetical protein